ncbi:MAG: hypothetical protein WC523_04930 [Patescibacteria group bacterium]
MVETAEECVWALGTPCEGVTCKKHLFTDQIDVPICEGHALEHRMIVALFSNGFDIEEVLNATPEWRREQALTLQLSGLVDLDKVAM